VQTELLTIPDTGRHGSARLAAITAIAEALGCQATSREPLTGHRHRSAHGDYYLTARGPVPVITWLARTLPGVLAELDQAATAATRGYAAWLRNGAPDGHHMPAWRPALRTSWRRAWLRGYGAALAARIAGLPVPPADPAPAGELYARHAAQLAGHQDATSAALAPYQPPPSRHSLDSPLLIAVPAGVPSRPGRILEHGGRRDGTRLPGPPFRNAPRPPQSAAAAVTKGTSMTSGPAPTCKGPACTRTLASQPTGRPPRYCSHACRQAAYRERLRIAEQARERAAQLAAARATMTRLAPQLGQRAAQGNDLMAAVARAATSGTPDALAHALGQLQAATSQLARLGQDYQHARHQAAASQPRSVTAPAPPWRR
jgi:hypothetical protein